MSNMLAALLGALRGIPKLPGALCVGRGGIFDDVELPDEALALCARCPALQRCRAWVDSLPPSRRPAGVIAGRVRPWSRSGGQA